MQAACILYTPDSPTSTSCMPGDRRRIVGRRRRTVEVLPEQNLFVTSPKLTATPIMPCSGAHSLITQRVAVCFVLSSVRACLLYLHSADWYGAGTWPRRVAEVEDRCRFRDGSCRSTARQRRLIIHLRRNEAPELPGRPAGRRPDQPFRTSTLFVGGPRPPVLYPRRARSGG